MITYTDITDEMSSMEVKLAWLQNCWAELQEAMNEHILTAIQQGKLPDEEVVVKAHSRGHLVAKHLRDLFPTHVGDEYEQLAQKAVDKWLRDAVAERQLNPELLQSTDDMESFRFTKYQTYSEDSRGDVRFNISRRLVRALHDAGKTLDELNEYLYEYPEDELGLDMVAEDGEVLSDHSSLENG